jgi:hypothetical protein
MADNRVTRYADEAQSRLVADVNKLRGVAHAKAVEVDMLYAQAEVLESQINTLKEILSQGNYEKNGKDEGGGN